MTDSLYLKISHRIIGAIFVLTFLVMGTIELLLPYTFEVVNSGPFPLQVSGILLFAAGIVCWPFILYPCVYDRFPGWVQQFPVQSLNALKALLGAR